MSSDKKPNTTPAACGNWLGNIAGRCRGPLGHDGRCIDHDANHPDKPRECGHHERWASPTTPWEPCSHPDCVARELAPGEAPTPPVSNTTTNCPRHGGTSTGGCVICNALPDTTTRHSACAKGCVIHPCPNCSPVQDQTTDQPYTDEQADELAASMRDTTTTYLAQAGGLSYVEWLRKYRPDAVAEIEADERARIERDVLAVFAAWDALDIEVLHKSDRDELLAAISGGDDATDYQQGTQDGWELAIQHVERIIEREIRNHGMDHDQRVRLLAAIRGGDDEA